VIGATAASSWGTTARSPTILAGRSVDHYASEDRLNLYAL